MTNFNNYDEPQNERDRERKREIMLSLFLGELFRKKATIFPQTVSIKLLQTINFRIVGT